jgi:hypothetical protein
LQVALEGLCQQIGAAVDAGGDNQPGPPEPRDSLFEHLLLKCTDLALRLMGHKKAPELEKKKLECTFGKPKPLSNPVDILL